MNRQTITTHGFSVHASNGEFIAWREHFDDALRRMRARKAPRAHCVRRCADGEIVAVMPRTIPNTPPPAACQSGAPDGHEIRVGYSVGVRA